MTQTTLHPTENMHSPYYWLGELTFPCDRLAARYLITKNGEKFIEIGRARFSRTDTMFVYYVRLRLDEVTTFHTLLDEVLKHAENWNQ